MYTLNLLFRRFCPHEVAPKNQKQAITLTQKNSFVFVTEPFALVGEVGKSIENLVDVSATSDSGAALEAKAIIEVTLKK